MYKNFMYALVVTGTLMQERQSTTSLNNASFSKGMEFFKYIGYSNSL